MKNINESEEEMTLVQSESKEEVIIERKNVDAAPKFLGCQIQANESWKAEMDQWESLALQFSMQVKTVNFDRICGAKLYGTY